ncbi:hypothetical protein RIF23_10465 [Lipingzhangella sp. LS1_29]|uniref:Uncharacterized protein n=1 Tax=Lipingzhangella rawalii TaxID=2055835 RepID=A0ABU2H6W7_9ACTN|nr:hypothetical protein [Lipingzhangella rawalii]
MADLRNHVTGINPREAARLLIYRPRYSTDTLFRGVHRLTERAVAHFGEHLWISYPEPAIHSTPRELASDADVLGAFVGTMDAAMDRRPWADETTLLHLTGGFDSGTVATRAAERHPGRFSTATLLIGGRAASSRSGAAPRCDPGCGLPKSTSSSTPCNTRHWGPGAAGSVET